MTCNIVGCQSVSLSVHQLAPTAWNLRSILRCLQWRTCGRYVSGGSHNPDQPLLHHTHTHTHTQTQISMYLSVSMRVTNSLPNFSYNSLTPLPHGS